MKIDTSLTMPQLPEGLSKAGLQFTLATEEDFEDIMAMSKDIYGGLDYLPTRYTSWLQEANRTVILARKQGKVVSLIYHFGIVWSCTSPQPSLRLSLKVGMKHKT